MRDFLASFLETVEIAFVAVVAVLVVKTFLVQPFLVSGDSMEPNFSDGNYLLVDELTYRFREVKRGEVVVFKYPDNNDVFYIKRVVGLPGEKVEIKNNEVIVYNKDYQDGLELSETYLGERVRTSGDLEIQLAEDEFFVMGDNRMASFDSRSWGPLKDDYILGLVRFNLWPLKEARAITLPSY